jgi:hypothetical protein
MQVFANGAMLVKGFDYTPNTSSYNLTLAFPNNFTLLNQQSYSRNGAA